MSDLLETACKFLESLERHELSTLLAECSIKIETAPDDLWFEVETEKAVITAPSPISEALRTLPPLEKKRVGEAVAYAFGSTSLLETIYVNELQTSISGRSCILAELLIHRAMMISVATGGSSIQDVNDHYRARSVRIARQIPADITYTNPHKSLWDWYHYYKQNLGGYADRRRYVNELFDPAINALSKRSSIQIPEREASGWERVDRVLSKAKASISLASAEEDFQHIGLLCREVLISLGQAVFDPLLHASPDGVEPSATDAARMIGAYIAFALQGSSNEEVRAHAKASLKLALALQHRRTANQKWAALCLEATSSTVAVISIIARPI